VSTHATQAFAMLLRKANIVSIRQHTSAYVSIRQHTPAYVNIRQHTSAYVSIRQHTSAYVSIRQHTSAYVSIKTKAEFPLFYYADEKKKAESVAYGGAARAGAIAAELLGRQSVCCQAFEKSCAGALPRSSTQV